MQIFLDSSIVQDKLGSSSSTNLSVFLSFSRYLVKTLRSTVFTDQNHSNSSISSSAEVKRGSRLKLSRDCSHTEVWANFNQVFICFKTLNVDTTSKNHSTSVVLYSNILLKDIRILNKFF